MNSNNSINETYNPNNWADSCVWHALLQKYMPYVTDSASERNDKLKDLRPLIKQLEEHSINLVKSKLFDQCMQLKQRLLHTPLSGAANDTFVAQGFVGSMCRDILIAENEDCDTYLYGGLAPADDFAAKNAGCSLQAASAYFGSLINQNSPSVGPILKSSLAPPLVWLVDYLGFRFYFSLLVPVMKSPIIYGTTHSDPITNKDASVHAALLSIGRVLNIASSKLNNKVNFRSTSDKLVEIASCVDFDIRLGDDGSKHFLDFRNAIPSEDTVVISHLPVIGHTQTFRCFRTELLLIWKDHGGGPLNPNISKGLLEDLDELEAKSVSTQVTQFLIKEIIPSFVKELIMHESKSSDKLYEISKLSRFAHRHGINIRHLGLVRSLLPNSGPGSAYKNLIFIELLARVLKSIIRERSRSLIKNHSGIVKDIEIKLLYSRILNDFILHPKLLDKISGLDIPQPIFSKFWFDLHKMMTEKFGTLSWFDNLSSSYKSTDLDISICSNLDANSKITTSIGEFYSKASINFIPVILRLNDLLNVTLENNTVTRFKEWYSKDKNSNSIKFDFSVSDLISIDPKVKHMPSLANILKTYNNSIILESSVPNNNTAAPVFISTRSSSPSITTKFNSGYNVINFESVKDIRILARGNFSSVLLGEYNNSLLVIKFNEQNYSPEAVLRELEPSISVGQHPNVVHTIGMVIDSARHVYGLAYEYASRGSLLSNIEQKPIDSVDKFCSFALDMARGLNHLHSKNIVHRDVALRNFVVNGDGRAQICDFGLSRFLSQGGSGSYVINNPSESIPIFGSAPETLLHRMNSFYSDVFMFGVALWELITSPPHIMPFHFARNQDGLLDLAQRGRLFLKLPLYFRSGSNDDTELIPKWIHSIVDSCFISDYSKRPSMSLIIEALEKREIINLSNLQDINSEDSSPNSNVNQVAPNPSFGSRDFPKSVNGISSLTDNYSIYENSPKDNLSIKCRYHCNSINPICRFVDIPSDSDYSSLLNLILFPQNLNWKLSYLDDDKDSIEISNAIDFHRFIAYSKLKGTSILDIKLYNL